MFSIKIENIELNKDIEKYFDIKVKLYFKLKNIKKLSLYL